MRENINPILFLDDWPLPPNSDGRTCPGEESELYLGTGMNQIRKWRIQTLLAVNPWGIPVMAFKEAYERMFPGKKFDPKDHGYENISSMVYDLPDIFAIQEPDEVTALMFPDYPHDKILHDARLGHDFVDLSAGSNNNINKTNVQQQDLDILESPIINNKQRQQQHQICRSLNSNTISDGSGSNSSGTTNGMLCNVGGKTIDPDILINYAWINRDTDFPPDVVLAGEQYADIILPLTNANIPETRGVHQAKIVSVANPGNFYINVKCSNQQQIDTMTNDIYQFFMQCGPNIDQYNVPEEFIYPGFPCLVWSKEFKCWERCVVVSRSDTRTNRVLVENVDHGGLNTVNRLHLYLMPRKFLQIPKQAINCSLIGVKPSENDDKWCRSISARMRYFSQPNYWLDILLVEPKVTSTNTTTTDRAPALTTTTTNKTLGHKSTATEVTDFVETASLSASVSVASIDSHAPGEEQSEQQQKQQAKSLRRKRIVQKKLDFEAIICDRHDKFGSMDIFLSDVLIMETYGSLDTTRATEYNSLKKLFENALASIPRPEFPPGFENFWPESVKEAQVE